MEMEPQNTAGRLQERGRGPTSLSSQPAILVGVSVAEGFGGTSRLPSRPPTAPELVRGFSMYVYTWTTAGEGRRFRVQRDLIRGLAGPKFRGE